MTDKAIGIFVFGMAFGGLAMIIAEAIDNTREERRITKMIKGSFRKYPYRNISFTTWEQVQFLENIIIDTFTIDIVEGVFLFDYNSLMVAFPDSLTQFILQVLYNTPGEATVLYSVIRKVVKA